MPYTQFQIHACAEKMVRDDAANPHKIEEIDIDKIISELDSDLWKAVCLLTQPRSAKNEKKNNKNYKHLQNQATILHMYFALWHS